MTWSEFTQELREFGGELLDELIPEPLQQILWVEPPAVHQHPGAGDRTVHPLGACPSAPAGPSTAEGDAVPRTDGPRPLALRQWLAAGATPQVRPTRARYVIPDYPDRRYVLPEAQLEREFLEDAFGAIAVEPQPTPVRKLISTKGAFDLLHFAGHGAADTDAIPEARLLLQGRIEGGRYIEAPFTTTTVNNRSDLTDADGSRPLVVLNACQAGRLGYALTRIGGFAQAFLHGGAGAFIGTQWSVGDAPARVFTETFYRGCWTVRRSPRPPWTPATRAGRRRAHGWPMPSTATRTPGLYAGSFLNRGNKGEDDGDAAQPRDAFRPDVIETVTDGDLSMTPPASAGRRRRELPQDVTAVRLQILAVQVMRASTGGSERPRAA